MTALQDITSTAPTLPAALTMGAVVLRSRDPDRLAPFYEQAVGLRVMARDADRLVLGAGLLPLVEIRRDAAAAPADRRAPGLFHLAVRVPNRRALAERVMALHQAGIRFGASDHLVSEALYIDDPDGNGVEIYCDRPKADWPWQDGRISMATMPLDLASLAPLAPPVPGPAPAGTDMGHVHLKVRDLAEAEAFWVGLLGFELMTTYPGALFVAAGGYHHHVGLNVWSSRGAPALKPGHVGLDHVTVRVPGTAVEALAERLKAARYPFETVDGALSLRDPSGNGVQFHAA
ncbi:VOC family protein [Aquabacter cavernae]|uniref:VOC family protein n=1 Tax=Aquabacter cavernae TaxID=2496029 RepID=UPI00196A5AC0|nr:VOC family protein [Aquabacter cavernae]